MSGGKPCKMYSPLSKVAFKKNYVDPRRAAYNVCHTSGGTMDGQIWMCIPHKRRLDKAHVQLPSLLEGFSNCERQGNSLHKKEAAVKPPSPCLGELHIDTGNWGFLLPPWVSQMR
eukprot:877596-Pelagomonas_calceolata.AAC.5